jgi:hypothetical protein
MVMSRRPFPWQERYSKARWHAGGHRGLLAAPPCAGLAAGGGRWRLTGESAAQACQGTMPVLAGASVEKTAMMATIAAYKAVAQDLPRSLERMAADPVIAQQTKTYLERIGAVRSLDDFMRDERVLSYALKAHGLEDMAYAKAFIRKVLEEGIDGDDTFANKLSDNRYRELAATFNFARYGATALTFTRAQEGTVDKFNRQALEVDAGTGNEGVRLALYFQRRAPEVGNVYDILADPALARVAQTLAGLPESIGAIDVDKQAAMIEWRLDIGDFKDAGKLDRMIERFTALWDVANASTAPASDELALFGAPALIGPDGDTLLALQGWRGVL